MHHSTGEAVNCKTFGVSFYHYYISEIMGRNFFSHLEQSHENSRGDTKQKQLQQRNTSRFSQQQEETIYIYVCILCLTSFAVILPSWLVSNSWKLSSKSSSDGAPSFSRASSSISSSLSPTVALISKPFSLAVSLSCLHSTVVRKWGISTTTWNRKEPDSWQLRNVTAKCVKAAKLRNLHDLEQVATNLLQKTAEKRAVDYDSGFTWIKTDIASTSYCG